MTTNETTKTMTDEELDAEEDRLLAVTDRIANLPQGQVNTILGKSPMMVRLEAVQRERLQRALAVMAAHKA